MQQTSRTWNHNSDVAGTHRGPSKINLLSSESIEPCGDYIIEKLININDIDVTQLQRDNFIFSLNKKGSVVLTEAIVSCSGKSDIGGKT